jgi:hypothetical protein
MPKIDLRGNFSLQRKDARPLGHGEFICPRTNPPAPIQLNADGNVLVNIADYEVSEEALAVLASNQDDNKANAASASQNEIAQMSRGLSSAARAVVALLKYHMGHTEIGEGLLASKSDEWRSGSSRWARIPMKLSVAVTANSITPLNEKTAAMVQSALNHQISPLQAMRHLHRAKNESQPHHKWIDATIAAELAIKEILIRARPDLETLITEVPSPPLDKMYGSIMQQYIGQRSPYVSIIKKGAATRNVLVHTPSTARIDHQEANDYVQAIEVAIFHALRLLYPEDPLLKRTPRGSHEH